MTKLICSSILLATMFLSASAAEARNSWDAFAGGLANGLSGQRLYEEPQAQQQFYMQPGQSPQSPTVSIVDTKTGRVITVNRQTGYWYDSAGNSGYIK